MEHLAEVLLLGILVLAVLRVGTGVVVGLLMSRRRHADRTRLGHAVAGVVGAVGLPVAVETVIGAPVGLISRLVTGWTAVAEMLAYIIGFSAVGAIVAVALYRNVRFGAPPADDEGLRRPGS